MTTSIKSGLSTVYCSGTQVVDAVFEGGSALANGILKTARFLLKHPILSAALAASIWHAFPGKPFCSSINIYFQNPNGLPFFDEYSGPLAAQSQIPASQLSEGWQPVSYGAFKVVYEHPSLPNHIVKIGCKSNMDEQFQNLKIAQEIVHSKNLDRIKIPHSAWIANLTKENLAVSLDEKLEFDSAENDLELAKEKEQLEQLIREGRFCDISLTSLAGPHNARLLSNGQIGVYDLDCRD